jgi:LysR family transcriptional activator of dmlA
LSCGKKIANPNLSFRIGTGDPFVGSTLAIGELGVSVLPLWLAKRPAFLGGLIPILPLWRAKPITLRALFLACHNLARLPC